MKLITGRIKRTQREGEEKLSGRSRALCPQGPPHQKTEHRVFDKMGCLTHAIMNGVVQMFWDMKKI